jgi:hypothetical protein
MRDASWSKIGQNSIAMQKIQFHQMQRMFGVPIDGPANVYCDNDSVCSNSTKPKSTLKKKQNAIAYHRVREAVAAGTIQVVWEPMDSNIADMLTKCLAGPALIVPLGIMVTME